jgi:hypothetical protein
MSVKNETEDHSHEVSTFCVVPVVTQGGGIGGGPIIAEDQARKREMRLLKNR